MTAIVPNRKTILFVDDDVQFLELLQPCMERLSDGTWEVIVASNSGIAINTLDSRSVDLAVLDVNMPVVDGLQLLSLLHRKHPQIKKAVLSSHVDAACRTAALAGGAELVLEKPTDAAGYGALYATLNELAQLQPESGFRGMLRRVGLEDIIQMECLSRHSLILEVTARGQRGRLFIRNGVLIHADFGEVTGEPALQKLLTLSGGEFNNRAFVDPPQITLEGSWEFLLMEAVRKRDEDAHAHQSDPAGGTPPAPSENPPLPDAPPDDPAVPVVNEIVICSEQGELLYAARSPQPQDRCVALLALMEVAGRLRALLPVGGLERVEFVSASGRMVARLHDGNGIFLRAGDQ